MRTVLRLKQWKQSCNNCTNNHVNELYCLHAISNGIFIWWSSYMPTLSTRICEKIVSRLCFYVVSFQNSFAFELCCSCFLTTSNKSWHLSDALSAGSFVGHNLILNPKGCTCVFVLRRLKQTFSSFYELISHGKTRYKSHGHVTAAVYT